MAFAAAAELGHERMDIGAAYWVQWAAGTALIPLVFALAAALGSPVAGLVAALLVATYPPLVAGTGDLLSEPLGALWLTGGDAGARAAPLRALAGCCWPRPC